MIPTTEIEYNCLFLQDTYYDFDEPRDEQNRIQNRRATGRGFKIVLDSFVFYNDSVLFIDTIRGEL